MGKVSVEDIKKQLDPEGHQKHYAKVCDGCGRVFYQCRCMAKNKEISFGICDNCSMNNHDTSNKGF